MYASLFIICLCGHFSILRKNVWQIMNKQSSVQTSSSSMIEDFNFFHFTKKKKIKTKIVLNILNCDTTMRHHNLYNFKSFKSYCILQFQLLLVIIIYTSIVIYFIICICRRYLLCVIKAFHVQNVGLYNSSIISITNCIVYSFSPEA